MTTRPLLSSVLVAAAGALIVALPQPAVAAETAPAGEALYCVYKPPTYVGGTEVLPAGRYCVPGP